MPTSTNTLAPLADVLALASPDAGRRALVERRLTVAGWTVTTSGVVLTAHRPLPGSRPVAAAASAAGLTFTEGALDAERAPGGYEALAAAAAAAATGVHREPLAVPGDAGFVWHDDAGAIVAVRSAAGRVPLWWWAAGGEACVGSRLSEVVATRPGPIELDRLAAPAFLAGQAAFPDDRSVIDGVRLVPPGSLLRFPAARSDGRGKGATADAGASVQRWFDPWPDRAAVVPSRRSAASFAPLAERFGNAVRAALAAELDPSGGNLLSLSGGVDSSSLAFLAGAMGLPLAALSLVPDDDDPLADREQSFVQPVVDQLGIQPHWARALTMEHRLEWLRAAPVAPVPVVHPVLCLLPELRRTWSGQVLVGGEFCDELSGGTFMLVDWARTASPSDVVSAVRHGIVRRSWAKRWLGYRWKGVAPTGPHQELPKVFQAHVRESWAAWRTARHQAVAASAKMHAYTIELLASLDGAVAMNWEVCSSLGMRRVWPFLTREVIEVVASLRPHDLVVPMRKRLSRTAFRGVVADRWLDRSDSGAFGKHREFTGASFGALPAELGALFRPEVAAGTERVDDEVAALAVAAGLQLARGLAAIREASGAAGPP